jgi:acetyltransferase-like isoleucine patch superfamily enzyme
MFRRYAVVIALIAFFLTLAVNTPIQASHPTSANRPISPSKASLDTASFIDPTVSLTKPWLVTVGQKVYIAPFAELHDEINEVGNINIGDETNVQDHVKIHAHWDKNRTPEQQKKVDNLNLNGVQIGQRVVRMNFRRQKSGIM